MRYMCADLMKMIGFSQGWLHKYIRLSGYTRPTLMQWIHWYHRIVIKKILGQSPHLKKQISMFPWSLWCGFAATVLDGVIVGYDVIKLDGRIPTARELRGDLRSVDNDSNVAANRPNPPSSPSASASESESESTSHIEPVSSRRPPIAIANASTPPTRSFVIALVVGRSTRKNQL